MTDSSRFVSLIFVVSLALWHGCSKARSQLAVMLLNDGICLKAQE